MGDLRRAISEVLQAHPQPFAKVGTAWSNDGRVKVVVGPHGRRIDLDIHPRLAHALTPAGLTALILATVRAAVEAANGTVAAAPEQAEQPGRADVGPPGQ
jgi:hypothetical protein